jgi:hypothetical protein
MKHIKKKFVLEMPVDQFRVRKEGKRFDSVKVEDIAKSKLPDPMTAIFIETEDGRVITAFQHKIDSKFYPIPEPDPVLIYFNNAQIGFRGIATEKKEFIESLDTSEGKQMLTDVVSHKLYDYMFASTSCAIFLFMAIEAMINKTIPPGYTFSRLNNQKRFTERYDYYQAQRLDFKTKLEELLPEITGKHFSKSHPTTMNHIHNLKKYRDTIVHTKINAAPTPYSDIFKTALTFNYVETIHSVRDLINFYQPGLVEECTCGRDF